MKKNDDNINVIPVKTIVYFNINKYKTIDKTKYNFQAIDGGKFNVSNNELDNFYRYCINIKNFSVCQVLPKNGTFKYYTDIDKFDITKYNIKTIVEKINEYIKKIYGITDLNFSVCKSSGFNKYHMYYNDVIVDRDNAKCLAKSINTILFNNDEILDCSTYSTCFRIPFVLKYNKKEGVYTENSDYELLDEDYNVVELTGFDLQNDRPLTEYYKELREVNIPVLSIFFINYINNHRVVGETKVEIFCNVLYKEFKNWCNEYCKKDYEITIQKFGREINKYKSIIKKKKSIVVYIINYDELRKELIEMKHLTDEV